MEKYHKFTFTLKYFVMILAAIAAVTFMATVGYDSMHALPRTLSISLVFIVDIGIAFGLWMRIAGTIFQTHKVNSYSRDIFESLTENLESLVNGNLDVDFTVKGADNYTQEVNPILTKMSNNINNLKGTLKFMISDVEMLASSAFEGKLNVRADAKQHKGCYAKLIEEVNQTLEVIDAPLAEAVKILEKMTVNDYTHRMDNQYKGTFLGFAESINLVQQRLLSVQDAFDRVGKGDTSRLEEFEKIGKRSENDRLMPACMSTMRSIRELIRQANMLATAALDGDLDVRGDDSKFEGGYKDIIVGMNHTMKAISTPIEEASSVMQELAKGNLTVSMTGEYKGDYNNIKQSLNTTIESFNNILNDISDASSKVATASNQVSTSAQSLSEGSTEQASSIEELTASIEEIAVQTKQNAINANEASELALSAKKDAIHGNDQMKDLSKAMDNIKESSTNISKIIKAIDDIAFQTNILALNAAVEAARAGQHGKGFAVVAEEVRNLAARSANAANETTALIEESIETFRVGSKIATDTVQALVKIVDGVEKATNLIGSIAIASNEQASGIEQINQGIMQVSDVTQTNSATAQQSAAASEELFSQAELLNNEVAKFKLLRPTRSSYDTEERYSGTYHKPKEMEMQSKVSSNRKKTAPKSIVLNDFGKY